MTDLSGLTVLGQTGVKPSKKIELFDAPSPGDVQHMTRQTILFSTDEFTSTCPVTGQPDFGEVHILYIPLDHCIESKSLKLYLQTFRNEGVFCEALAQQICNDLAAQVKPEAMVVKIVQKPRGGIGLVATSMYLAQLESKNNNRNLFIADLFLRMVGV